MLLSQYPLTFLLAQQGILFFHTALDYFHSDWDGVHDYVKNSPWEDILSLDASVANTDFFL